MLRGPRIVALAWVAATCGWAASDRIASIDFYGYGSLDPSALRALLPFHEGDPLPSDRLNAQARAALQRTSGRSAVEISPVLGAGGWTLYIGLAEPDAPPLKFNPHPTANLKLPPDVLKLFDRMDKDWLDAIKSGTAEEDDSAGYAVSKDSDTRGDQLKLRDWAQTHTATLLRVLETSAHIDQRQRAAEAVAYSGHSPQQISALVRAASDADAGVRNASLRALAVLCVLGPEITRQIPGARFVPLLHSLHWTDRNKTSMLFRRLTDTPDPALLDVLRERALDPLREMMRWKDKGHAYPGATLLGRIAGLPDARTNELFEAGKLDEILDALR